MRRLPLVVAVAIIGVVVTLVFDSQVASDTAVPLARGQSDQALRDASVDGFRSGMFLAAGLAFAGAAVGAVGIVNREGVEAARSRTFATASSLVSPDP